MINRLEVGCGIRKRKGYVGMDKVRLDGVDVLHDMNIIPWPFPNDYFDEILFDDVLEHAKDIIPIMSEVYRIAKNNCIIKISVPHYSSDNMYTDPTHNIFFSSRSFDYFERGGGGAV
jgi:predicted SAM-dependent methyltransferase